MLVAGFAAVATLAVLAATIWNSPYRAKDLTGVVTAAPTASPSTSVAPTASPTLAPTLAPTASGAPTVAPTLTPTIAPTVAPTVAPTLPPTVTPTQAPTTLLGSVISDGVTVTLSSASIAGIVVGGVALIALVAFGIRRRGKRRTKARHPRDNDAEDGDGLISRRKKHATDKEKNANGRRDRGDDEVNEDDEEEEDEEPDASVSASGLGHTTGGGTARPTRPLPPKRIRRGEPSEADLSDGDPDEAPRLVRAPSVAPRTTRTSTTTRTAPRTGGSQVAPVAASASAAAAAAGIEPHETWDLNVSAPVPSPLDPAPSKERDGSAVAQDSPSAMVSMEVTEATRESLEALGMTVIDTAAYRNASQQPPPLPPPPPSYPPPPPQPQSQPPSDGPVHIDDVRDAYASLESP